MMSSPDVMHPPVYSLEIFVPRPGELYDLGAAAAMACVPRRIVLLYVRAGLVAAEVLPPYGVLAFTEDAIYAIRRVEQVRRLHGVDIGLLTALFQLLVEIGPMPLARSTAGVL